MRRLWVTRAQPGADATAERLRTIAYEPLVAPLLTLSPTTDTPPDLANVAALAFSSANGVAAFAALSTERSLTTYAVGEATAAAARRAGFTDVRSAQGDVAALADRILADRAALKGAVLHLAPAKAAGDLVGALQAQGVSARRAVLYAAAPAAGLPATVAQGLMAGTLDGVLVHSPEAARVLARLAPGLPGLRALPAYVLSDACAAPLREAGWPPPHVADFPSEEALLTLLPR